MPITFYNSTGAFENVPSSFTSSCEIMKNMLEDVDADEIDEDTTFPWNIPEDFDIEIVKKLIDFYTRIDDLTIEVSTDYDEKVSDHIPYLDYLLNQREDFIKKYTNQNADPPHCETILKIFNEYDKEIPKKDADDSKDHGGEKDADGSEDHGGKPKRYFNEFMTMEKYFNNKRLRQAFMLCIVVYIRVGEEDKVDAIMSSIMKILQEEQNQL